jgi:hypothetical protein
MSISMERVCLTNGNKKRMLHAALGWQDQYPLLSIKHVHLPNLWWWQQQWWWWWEGTGYADTQRLPNILCNLNISFPCSQELYNGSYLEPNKFRPYHSILSLYDSFQYYPPTYVFVSLVVSFFLAFPPITYCTISNQICIHFTVLED